MAARVAVPVSMTAADFIATLSTIPFHPAQGEARGLLAPLLRSTGHILYLIGATAEESHVVKPEEEINELNAAAAHLNSTLLLNVPATSDEAKQHIKTYATAVTTIKDHYGNWSPEEKNTALRNLANRGAGLAAFLDRELTGLNPAESDPGSQL